MKYNRENPNSRENKFSSPNDQLIAYDYTLYDCNKFNL